MKNSKFIIYLILALTAFFFFSTGIVTPLSKEAQLIAKAFLMLVTCYAVVFGLTSTFAITSKKIKLRQFLMQWLYLIYAVLLVLFLINVPFDYMMMFFGDRYLPNEACSIIAFVLIFSTVCFKNMMFSKING